MNKANIQAVLATTTNVAASFAAKLYAQTVATNNPTLNQAFSMAMSTLDKNITPDGLILAGGDYGGEWTRDCAFNSANAASLLRPDAAEHSLWSVTNNRSSVGHQYWDKIIWVIAAWNHYMATADNAFLADALRCATATIAELESTCYNASYKLFAGPAVFQDGIAGYDAPIYQAGNNSSYVLDHDAKNIMCLSTNCVYYKAYQCIADMTWQSGHDGSAYENKAKQLKKAIRANFYDKRNNRLI